MVTREGEGNWNIWQKKKQELNPNTSENYHLNSTGVYVTTHLLLSVAYPGILFGGGTSNPVEDRERGSGGGSPLVRVLEAAVIWYQKFHFM